MNTVARYSCLLRHLALSPWHCHRSEVAGSPSLPSCHLTARNRIHAKFARRIRLQHHKLLQLHGGGRKKTLRERQELYSRLSSRDQATIVAAEVPSLLKIKGDEEGPQQKSTLAGFFDLKRIVHREFVPSCTRIAPDPNCDLQRNVTE